MERTPDDHKVKWKNLIKQYSGIFSKTETIIGYCKKVKHEIIRKNACKIAILLRKIPMGLKDEVDKMVEGLL